MAKQEKRVARKDYPADGIARGDTYYFAQIKTGARSSQTIRSKTPIPESRLTTSPFKSGWLAAQEDWEASDKGGDAIRAASEAIRALGEEAESAYENLPENFQNGQTGELLQARSEKATEVADELDNLADRMDETEAPDEVEEPDPDDDGEVDEAAQSAWDEYETALEEYQSEVDAIIDEVDGQLGDMPE